MLILGVSEGPEGGAAVVVDDRVVAVVDQATTEGTDVARGFPWEAADKALALAGATRADVDEVMVAGKFTPLFLRRRPTLRRLIEAPFSPVLDASVAVQAVLRHSGVGAFQADVAAAWMHERFADRGYQQRRTVAVEVHRALAEAAYRLQPIDDALVLTLHPLGDGVALAVHVGRCGQLDRVFVQKGFESLHTHLRRVLAALDVPEGSLHHLGALAAGAEPDPRLDRLLAERFAADGPRLSRGAYPWRTPRTDEVFARIAELPRPVAAASVLENLVTTVEEVARWHLRDQGCGHLCVAGYVFEEPRVAARLLDLTGARSLSVLPRPGGGLLAVGAAADGGGLAPHAADLRVGEGVDPFDVDAVLRASGLQPSPPDGLVEALVEGGAVAWHVGRRGRGRLAQGARCVLARPDRPATLQRVRMGLNQAANEEAVLLVPEGSPLIPDRVAVAGCVAPVVAGGRIRLARGGDDRVAVLPVGGPLAEVVRSVGAVTGVEALAALPLAEGAGPLSLEPRHAVEMWRRARLDALRIGDVFVDGR